MSHHITYRPIAELAPYARNARTHSDAQLAQLASAIEEFGWTNPVLADAQGIVAGHGRVMAAQRLYARGLTIRHPGGSEIPTGTVPVIDCTGWSDTQRRAYILADNQLALQAGWDEKLLAQELADLQALDCDLVWMAGFAADDVAALVASLEDGDDEQDEDEVPSPPAEPRTRRGDVWLLGNHRLLCGDSASDRHAFLEGVAPDLLYLDPPYEIEEAWTWTVPTEKALVFTDHKHLREPMAVVLSYPVQYHFVWDTVISWYTPNRPLCRHRSAFYCAQEPGWEMDAATFHDGKARTEKVVSDGQAFDGRYHYQPLPAGRVRLTTCYQQSKTLDEAGNGEPVAWVRALLAGAQAREVFEPFAGTGATIIAAPPGCRVHSIEIDPRKCDAIVARWEQAMGEKAVRA